MEKKCVGCKREFPNAELDDKNCSKCGEPLIDSDKEITKATEEEKSEILEVALPNVEQHYFSTMWRTRRYPQRRRYIVIHKNIRYMVVLPSRPRYFYHCKWCRWKEAQGPILPKKCSGCGKSLYFQRNYQLFPKINLHLHLPSINVFKIF